MNQWRLDGVQLQDIKNEPITETQIDEMAALAGSTEALFSKRARKYKELGLKDKTLNDSDIRALILEECTFLKRPVLIHDGAIFIGNSPKVVAAAAAALG
jgi:arsenate reductase-like glutaredoxin family protein